MNQEEPLKINELDKNASKIGIGGYLAPETD